jgi:type II secretory pathway predicted ATPase ExeA
MHTLHEMARDVGAESFYGLAERSFALAPNPAFFFASRAHLVAFNQLRSAIERRDGLSVLSGDIGLGKTTLCRAVLQRLDRTIFSAFVPDPFVSREDFLKIVLIDFGIASTEDLTSGRLKGASRTELGYLLHEFLDTLVPLQAFAVVIVDEAQHLSPSLLDEIRILADGEGRKNRLQVVLVGQPELQSKLRLPETRQIAQRVTTSCTIGPLDRDGVAGYISHRLHVAGAADRVRFAPPAVDAVFAASGGVPRLINRVCSVALERAAASQALDVDLSTVVTAIRECGLDLPAPATATAPAPAPVPSNVAPEGRVAAEAEAEVDPEMVVAANEPAQSDEWFSAVDRHVRTATLLAGVRGAQTDGALSFPVMPGTLRGEAEVLTPLQHWSRRLLRQVRVAMLLVALLAGAGLGVSIAWAVLEPAISAAAEP